jgi:hypothetical protein
MDVQVAPSVGGAAGEGAAELDGVDAGVGAEHDHGSFVERAVTRARHAST